MHRYTAVVPPGLERLAAREIRALGGGIGKTSADAGRVYFEGPADAGMRANLHLRIPERILLPLGRVRARHFEPLRLALSEMPFERWLPPGLPLRIAVSTKGCRLFHTDALEDCVREALVTRGLRHAAPGEDKTKALLTVDLRGQKDEWICSVDTTGRPLWRRGYRLRTARAPMRENLAAACLMAAGYDGGPFLDPFCGSGTFPIEAAWMASHRAPGLDRPFLFESFAGHDPKRWAELIGKARAAITADPPVEGSDRSQGGVQAARENAKRAGVHIRLIRRRVADAPAGRPPGFIVCNPPYGKRADLAGDEAPTEDPTEAPSEDPTEDATALWASWGESLRAARPGWNLAVVAANPELAKAFGARGKPLLRFRNGGIPVALWSAGA